MSIKNKKVSLPNMSNNLVIPKIRKELFITHPTNFKSVVILCNPQSP